MARMDHRRIGENEMQTRKEHLQWCKDRAREYVEAGDVAQACASMVSDLRIHPETQDHSGIELMSMMMMAGHLNDGDRMRSFIEGFN